VIDEGASARLSNLVVDLGLLAWIKVTWLKELECTKIWQLLRRKGFVLRMLGCLPMSVCWKVKDYERRS
jgi:hypothetical protein